MLAERPTISKAQGAWLCRGGDSVYRASAETKARSWASPDSLCSWACSLFLETSHPSLCKDSGCLIRRAPTSSNELSSMQGTCVEEACCSAALVVTQSHSTGLQGIGRWRGEKLYAAPWGQPSTSCPSLSFWDRKQTFVLLPSFPQAVSGSSLWEVRHTLCRGVNKAFQKDNCKANWKYRKLKFSGHRCKLISSKRKTNLKMWLGKMWSCTYSQCLKFRFNGPWEGKVRC